MPRNETESAFWPGKGLWSCYDVDYAGGKLQGIFSVRYLFVKMPVVQKLMFTSCIYIGSGTKMYA